MDIREMKDFWKEEKKSLVTTNVLGLSTKQSQSLSSHTKSILNKFIQGCKKAVPGSNQLVGWWCNGVVYFQREA